jgi:hypothetical protein
VREWHGEGEREGGLWTRVVGECVFREKGRQTGRDRASWPCDGGFRLTHLIGCQPEGEGWGCGELLGGGHSPQLP